MRTLGTHEVATWQVSALHAYTGYMEIDSHNLKHVDVAQHYRRGLSDFSNLVDVSEPLFYSLTLISTV